jgi:hypothetical protein
LSLSNPALRSNAGPAVRVGSATGRSGSSTAPAVLGRVYRLVDRQGNPHPVLDDLYDTLEAAWTEAQTWWGEQRGEADSVGIGVEVSTSSGSWRTLRYPAG